MENLHKEVVTGIVQVVKHLDAKRKEGNTSFNFGELFRAGFRGRTEDAQTYICEFVKGGVGSLRQEDFDAVARGDYEKVWRSTNAYLTAFGYEPVKPEPISPDFTTEQ